MPSIVGEEIRMTQLKTAAGRPPPAQRRDERREPLPTCRNTRPRGNPEPDRRDLERSVERFEMLLGR
jgi:hypothetical protein